MEPRVRMLRAVAAALLMSILRVCIGTAPPASAAAAAIAAGLSPAGSGRPVTGTFVPRSKLIFACVRFGSQLGSAREGNGQVTASREQGLIAPEDAPRLTTSDFAPAFTQRMDMRRADPASGSPQGTIRRWVRLKDRSGLTPAAELVGIGDALPPGSARAMERMGPISSITWALTLLGDVPETREGWWLLETASNHMDQGFSSETLRMWTSEGVEVMRGLQSVAVFG